MIGLRPSKFWNAPFELRAGSTPTPTPSRTRLSQKAAADKDLSFHVPPHFRPLRIVSESLNSIYCSQTAYCKRPSSGRGRITVVTPRSPLPALDSWSTLPQAAVSVPFSLKSLLSASGLIHLLLLPHHHLTFHVFDTTKRLSTSQQAAFTSGQSRHTISRRADPRIPWNWAAGSSESVERESG